jgi:hypothetical protein
LDHHLEQHRQRQSHDLHRHSRHEPHELLSRQAIARSLTACVIRLGGFPSTQNCSSDFGSELCIPLQLKANQPVEASFEFARRPVHENNCRAITHVDDAAEFAADPYDVVYAKPEWLLSIGCDKAGEFGLLAWLFHDAFRTLSDDHRHFVSG